MVQMFDTPSYDPNADEGPFISRVSAAMICVSGVAVALRFLARRLVRQPILWDDWMILIAIPFSWTTCIIQITAAQTSGYGRHIQFATPDQVLMFFKLLYALQIVYLFAILFIKFSILLFYRRIFHIPQTKLPAMMIAVVVGAWFVGTLLPGIFSCLPVHGFWDRSIQPQCIDPIKYYLGVAIPNVVTDIVMIAIPIPLIWKLHISLSQKIAVSGIFMLGGFIILVSTLRLVSLFQAEGTLDITWGLVPLGIWNVVETNVGIICASLPSMQPLLRILLGQKFNGTKDSDAKYRYFSGSGSAKPVGSSDFTRLNDSNSARANEPFDQEVSVYSNGKSDNIELQDRLTSREIHVKKIIEWENAAR